MATSVLLDTAKAYQTTLCGSDEIVVDLEFQLSRPSRQYLAVKRSLDLFIAVTFLLILSPFLLLLALLIKLDSRGPVLFKQERVGYDPRTGQRRNFTVYKFRTMQHRCDDTIHRNHTRDLIVNNVRPSADRPDLKLTKDGRITRMGRILRRTSLDELPQLLNVLRGEMSMVGPRPALPYEVDCYQEWHRRRLLALPGITGWWQVKGRNRVSFDEMVNMDVYYIEHQSFLLDFKIMLLTVRAMYTGKGAG